MKLEKHFRWPKHEMAYVGLFLFFIFAFYTLFGLFTGRQPEIEADWLEYFTGTLFLAALCLNIFCHFIYVPCFMLLYKDVYGKEAYDSYSGWACTFSGMFLGLMYELITEKFLEDTDPAIETHQRYIWHCHVLKWAFGWGWIAMILFGAAWYKKTTLLGS